MRRFAKFMIAATMSLAALASTPAEANSHATQLLNQMRAQQGQAPVNYSRHLERVAHAYAKELRSRGMLSHTGLRGSTPGTRARDKGYKWCYIAENLAQGPWDLNGVMRAWHQSPGHARNLYNPKAREFALAQVSDGYWVMILAKPGCR